MNRAQIIELVEQTGGLDQVVDVAEQLVDALESRGLLKIGDARRWRVTVDDPNARREYVYEDVEAATAAGACLVGARRAIRDDEGATIGAGHEVEAEWRAMLAERPADDGLIRSVVAYTVAAEIGIPAVCTARGFCAFPQKFTDPPSTAERCWDCGRAKGDAS